MKSVHDIVVNIFLEEKKHCLRYYLFDMNYRLHNTGSNSVFMNITRENMLAVLLPN